MLTPDDNAPVCADITKLRDHIVTHSGGSNPGPGPGEPRERQETEEDKPLQLINYPALALASQITTILSTALTKVNFALFCSPSRRGLLLEQTEDFSVVVKLSQTDFRLIAPSGY